MVSYRILTSAINKFLEAGSLGSPDGLAYAGRCYQFFGGSADIKKAV